MRIRNYMRGRRIQKLEKKKSRVEERLNAVRALDESSAVLDEARAMFEKPDAKVSEKLQKAGLDRHLDDLNDIEKLVLLDKRIKELKAKQQK